VDRFDVTADFSDNEPTDPNREEELGSADSSGRHGRRREAEASTNVVSSNDTGEGAEADSKPATAAVTEARLDIRV
jgi:hypothetical protein